MKRYLYRIVQSMRTTLPEEAVARTARATGLGQRAREIGSVPFLWSFLFGTTQPGGAVTKVRDFYEVFTAHEAAYSSIQQWITPELKQLLVDLIAHLSIELGATEPALGGRFDRFRDVFITDATDCTPSPAFFEDFPGYSDDHAGARLHIIELLASRASFLRSLEGRDLQDVLPDLYRSEIDAQARFDTPSSESDFLPREFRLVGLRHDEATDEEDAPDADHDYHLYVTYLPKEWFSPREIAALYSVRWNIETLIQEGKSVYGLDEILVRKKDSVECFMLASLVMVLLSRYVLRQIRAGLGFACDEAVEEETEMQETETQPAQGVIESVINPLSEHRKAEPDG